MRKTFAILLSLVLVAVAVFAFAVSASADAPLADNVTFTTTEGKTVVLNATDTEYIGNDTDKTEGIITFDADKAILTIEDIKGFKKMSFSKSLTLVVKGENFIEDEKGSEVIVQQVVNADDALEKECVFTVKGDGKLNVVASIYAIVVKRNIEITDKVTVNVNCVLEDRNGWSEGIHVNNQGKDMIFSGDAVVNCTSHGMSAIRSASEQGGSVIVKDNAKVTGIVENPAKDSVRALHAPNFKMTGGELTLLVHEIYGGVNYNGSNSKIPGVASMYGMVVTGKTEVLGGKIDIDVVSDYTETSTAVGMHLEGKDPIVLEKANIDILVKYGRGVSSTPGAIQTKNAKEMTITNCNLKIDAPLATYAISVNDVAAKKRDAIFDLKFIGSKVEGNSIYMIGSPDTAEKDLFVSEIKIGFDKTNSADYRVTKGVVAGSCTVTTDATFLSGADFTSKVGLVTGDPSVQAFTVSITPPAGSDIVLSASKRNLTEKDAAKLGVALDAISYDPYTATVYLNNANGSIYRIWASNAVTFNVKGENSVVMPQAPSGGTNSAFGTNGSMTITGDGSLTVGGYVYAMLCYSSLTVEKDVNVKVISQSTNAIHIGAQSGDALDARPMIVKDNAKVDVLATDRGIYIAGSSPSLELQDNAKVTVSPANKEKAFNQGVLLYTNSDNKTGSQDMVLTVSDKASLVIAGGQRGVELNCYADDEKGIATTTVVNTVVEITDDASVDLTGSAQALLYNTDKKNNVNVLRISENANAKFTQIDATKKGESCAAVWLSGPDNTVTMTTSGRVDMNATSSGWRGAFYITGVKYDVLIEDTTLNVSNISSSIAKNGADIANGINFDCKGDGKFVIGGKAVVSTYAEKNGEEYANRAHGLFLHPDHVLTIQDDAVFNASAGGDSKDSTGAGIHLKASAIVVKDNGKMNILAKGTAVAGVTFESKSSITAEGNAYVTIVGEGKDVSAIRAYNRSAKGVIEVKDGTSVVEMFGDPAVNVKNRKTTFTCSSIKAGDTKEKAKAVENVTGKEGYVILMGQNPKTSDISVAPFIILGLMAVAATSAVILRKRHSN